MLFPRGFEDSVVTEPGVVLSGLPSARIHFSLPSYNICFSLKNTPAAVVTLGPAVHPGSRTWSLPHCNSCFFPPPSLCPCSALMPRAPSCTVGYWNYGS